MRRPPSKLLGVVFGLTLGVFFSPGCDKKSPPGTPCSDPFSCVSGLCLTEGDGTTAGRCAQRCASDGECPHGQVCGRFDFRGRDDSGVLDGPQDDVVRVCRIPINTVCTGGCMFTGERCLGAPSGVCAPLCSNADTCGGRDCVLLFGDSGSVCGPRVCAPPCDTLAECPAHWTCDLARIDLLGHGQCIPIDAQDASVTADCDAAANP